MNKKKKIIAVVIIAIVGTIIFWKRDWIKEKLGLSMADEENQSGPNDNFKPVPQPSPIYIPRTLYKECNGDLMVGCKGERVKKIQAALNKNYKSGLIVDGYFGPLTERALLDAGYNKKLTVFDTVRIMYLNPNNVTKIGIY
ncbi:MAG TPA: hypothetical protein DEA97_06450 [Bacteroidales bacterium]|nr:MAG: hypothetical protein UR43_C0021G0010 [candidate division TM6 bacterium GW2011_GWF2_33_332]OFY79626.1 MAG: hypothetical protein A2281_13455 [Bacteroidetes bacterium RIFOXYA12_FULL_38_20]HBS86175.1 hypothetical protein [Bacteroidales bacterium]